MIINVCQNVYQLVLKVLKVKILKHNFCSILRKHGIIKIYGPRYQSRNSPMLNICIRKYTDLATILVVADSHHPILALEKAVLPLHNDISIPFNYITSHQKDLFWKDYFLGELN